MNKFWSHRAPAIFWALVLFTLSSIPKLQSPFHLSKWDDKLNHFVAYAILGALTLRAFSVNRPVPQKRELSMSLAVGFFYGALDEVHQYFVPGRFMDHKDFIADAAGVTVGVLLYLWLCKRRSTKQKVE